MFRAGSALGADGAVYFFGGALPVNATNNFNYQDNMGYYSFDHLLTFYPKKNQTFDVVDASSSITPNLRQLHTVNASKLLLLFFYTKSLEKIILTSSVFF